MIIWFETIPGWVDSNWIQAWSIVGDINEVCTDNGYDYQLISRDGLPVTTRLPFGIKFKHAEEATLFKLIYDCSHS